MLALVASAVGLGIAQYGIDLGNGIMLAEMNGRAPFWLDVGLTAETVLLTVALAVATAAVVGVMPALRATRPGVQQELRHAGGGGAGLGGTWTALIVAQVAIAVAALPIAIGMGWHQIEQGANRPTYAADQFVEAELVADSDGAASQYADFGVNLAEVMRRLDADPAVAGVTFRASLPGRGGLIRIADVPAPERSSAWHAVRTIGVAPNMIELFDIDVLAGRAFDAGDAGAGATAVIVNESFVQQVLGGGNAIGLRIRHVTPEEAAGHAAVPTQWYEVVGVVRSLVANRLNPVHVPPAVLYAVAPDQVSSATIVARMRTGTTIAGIAPIVREHVAAADPTLRLGPVRSLAADGNQLEAAAKLIAVSVALVLVSVLLLSAAGIYAMMSFIVTQRRREIGIRSALGARPRQLLGSVFARATRQIGGGLCVGVAVAALFDLGSGGTLLHGRSAIIIPALAASMALVGVLAALKPALRGLRIAPSEALRADG